MNPHTDTTLKLPSDFSATVKALLDTPAPPSAADILRAPKKRTQRRKFGKG